MNSERRKLRISTFWVLHISCWLAYSALGAIISYKTMWADIRQLFLVVLVPNVGGFLACIPLRYFYRKIRLHELPMKSVVPIALGASFIGTHLWLGTEIVIGLFLSMPDEAAIPLIQVYVHYIINGGVFLVGWTSLYFSLKIWRAWKQQERMADQANSLAQSAQQTMLRYQLNPHFLFNTMNSIRALIDEDDAKAREMITELSEFLRYSLESKDFSDVPLKNEIEAVKHYLAIQKKRYENKLEVSYDIDPQAGEYPVLSFLIHPLVENTIKYGMHTSPMPLGVGLKAHVREGGLWIEVSNTGRWIEPEDREGHPGEGTGTGLNNVRRRLENAFPGRHRFLVFEKEGRVHIILNIRKPLGKEDEKVL